MTVSYIIPIFKTPLPLRERCLASVRAIAAPEDEIIEIDNMGLVEARNEGLRRAKGDWIRFVDADDEVLCGFDLAKFADVDVVVFGVRTKWGTHGKAIEAIPGMVDGLPKAAQLAELNASLLFRYAWNKLYRRAFLLENGLVFELKTEPTEDSIFNLKCVLAGARWRSVPQVGYIYWKRLASSLSHYFPNLEAAVRRENELWERVGGCQKCIVSDERIARYVWGNRWLSKDEESDPPLSWRLYWLIVMSRRLLHYVGI